MYGFQNKPEYHVYYGVTQHSPAFTGFVSPDVEPSSTVCDDVTMGNTEEDMDMG